MAIKEKIVITADDKTSKAFREVQKSAKKMSDGLATMSRNMGVFTLAGAAAAAGLFLLTKNVIENVRALKTQADMAGVGVEAFQELEFAASRYKITQEAVTDGLKELALRGDEFAKTGKGSAAEAFERLGFTAADLNERLSDTPALLEEVASRMEGLGKAAQIRIADELFGGQGGEQFLAMLSDGADGIARLRQEARDLGIVLSADTVAQAEAASDELLRMQKIISVNLQRALLDVLPVLESVTEGIATLTKNTKLALAVFKDAEDLDMTEAAHQVDLARESADRLHEVIGRLQAQKKRQGALTPMDAARLAAMNTQLTKALTTLGAWEARLSKLRRDAETGGDTGDDGDTDNIIIKTIDNERKRAEALLTALEQTHLQVMGRESELIDLRVEQELEKLAGLHEAKTISEMEFLEAESNVYMTALERKRLLAEENEAVITANQKAEFEAREEAAKTLADAELAARRGLHDGLSAIAALQNVQSRKMFEVGKAAAASLALVKTYEGAQGVFASAAQVPYVGWILAPIAAAAAVVSGLANVQAIMSASYGGGGGGRGRGGGGVGMPSIPSVDVPAMAAPANDERVPTTVFVNIESDNGMVSTQWIRDNLLPGIDEAIGDGFTLKSA